MISALHKGEIWNFIEMGNRKMSLEQKIQLSVVIILTGMVIVFVMLIFLTYLIKGYGAVVRKLQASLGAQNGTQNKEKPLLATPVSHAKPVPAVEAGIPGEVIAAISAAVYMTYGASVGNVTSIRRAAQPARSAWGMAGLLENTRPFI